MTDGEKKDEDFELLAEFNDGSEEAFTKIVERHSGPLINFLHRYTLDRTVSEDLAQETFLRLYKAAPDLKPDARLSTVVYTIAYHLAVDRARTNKSRGARLQVRSLDTGREDGPSMDPPADPGTGPEALYEKTLRSKELSDALAGLPETQRSALLLRAYEGRSYAEIADIMGVSVPAVESLLVRARRALAEKLR